MIMGHLPESIPHWDTYQRVSLIGIPTSECPEKGGGDVMPQPLAVRALRKRMLLRGYKQVSFKLVEKKRGDFPKYRITAIDPVFNQKLSVVYDTYEMSYILSGWKK